MDTWEIVGIVAVVWIAVTYIIVRHIHTHPSVPMCFADQPQNYQHQAEFDCPHCDVESECALATKRGDRLGPR